MIFLLRVRFFILLAALVWAGLGTPARAEGLTPLPSLSANFDLSAYAAGTETARKENPEIPGASFELSLPKTWIERTTIDQDYGEIVRYEGPAFGDVLPFFSLRRIKLDRENTARLEIIAYMLQQGYVLRALDAPDDRNAEALYVMVDKNGDSFAVRTKARINGSDLFLAEYALPVQAFNRNRDAQTFSMGSFKFLHDDPEATIEKRVERTYFKALRFYYPASWLFVGEDAPADNAVTVNLASKGPTGIETGRIRLSLLSTRSIKDEKAKNIFAVDLPGQLTARRKAYEDAGYMLGEKIESKKPDLNLPAIFAMEDVYNLRLKTTSYETDKQTPVTHELWIAVFKATDPKGVEKTYMAELFTPARTQDMRIWAVNTRAFDLILKSVQ